MTLAILPTSAVAQPVGEEFQVNTYTTFYQGSGSVAAAASGNFVVVWSSGSVQYGDSFDIFGQRYDSNGTARGEEFQVNTYTTDRQGRPDVAFDASGNFVVIWDGSGEGDSYFGIFGQRYDKSGHAVGGEFRINTTTSGPGRQEDPSVAMDAAGNFVVVWDCDTGGPYLNCATYGQRFAANGEPRGSEFQIGSTNSTQPSVASDASGNFVVVHNRGDIVGRRYDNEGVPQGAEFRVNTYTTQGQGAPSVASDTSGNFVVVWESFLQDGDWFGIFGQRYNSQGVAQGAEFRVNSYTPEWQSDTDVAIDGSGNFVVVWASGGVGGGPDQDGSEFGVFGQRYDKMGVPQGGEFRINSYTPGEQRLPSVAATGTAAFVVVWRSAYQDGSEDGVFGQRYDSSGADTITVVSPNTDARWRIGSLRNVQWTHSLGPDATFRIELDRDDDGVYEELIASAAPVDSETRGHVAWTVTGPHSATARVRVAWTDDPGVFDSSDITFQIRPAPFGATGELLQR